MTNTFQASLLPIEQQYWEKLMTLFAQVNPNKPELGCRVLIERARILAQTKNIPLESALAEIYAGAQQRTQRRVQLLKQCDLQQ